MTDYNQPFDIIDDLKGEKVEVHLEDGTYLTGVLHAFDKYQNLALTDVRVFDGDEREFERFYQNGDSVMNVRPAE